ncbi:MAG: N-acyl-D-amino-acid deacylase [Spirosomataceae bacterium]|jgi:N-acyl-D-amino-acid deacylase
MKIILFVLLSCSLSFAQQYDLIIKNARIVDGTGNAWYRGDIAIDKGKIAAIGQVDGRTKKTIDVQGKVVSPGFIDIHTHVEHTISSIPTADNFIHDGVTTIITGNCGSSEVDIERFFKRLQTKPTSVNVGTLIGHNDVREFVMKKEMRSPSAAEQQRMESLVAKAMQDGALGLSTGLIYIPGTYAETNEVIGLAKAASAEGGVYVSHIRNEGATVKEAIEEAINIGREANIPVQISHFKISAKPLWGKSYETIGMVEAARKEGIDVTIDQYPYTASSTNMGTMLPSWALAGGDVEMHKRLMNPATRKKIKAEMLKDLKADDRTNFDYAVIARYAPDTSLQGKNISQINKAKKRPETADSEAELIMNLVDKGFAQMIFHKMSEDDVQAIVRYPFTMIASDAGIYEFNKNQPHPRGYGSNARVLGRYVRDFQAFGLEEAIRKMTSLPASRFGIKNRGLLQEGYAADLVIFDENTIKDEATFDKPHAYSTGIDYVIVNGEITLENGKHTGVLKGEVVRK